MDYEKKYKEALERAKEKYTKCYSPTLLDYIFPELKENKDIEIKKDIIRSLKTYIKCIKDGYDAPSTKDFIVKETEKQIAWLEKQGKKEAENKFEPKFKVGDEIKTGNKESLTITKIDEKGYWSEDLFICSFEDSAKWELVGKPVNMIKPKFKVGDWVVFTNGNVEHIISVGTHGYTFDDGDYLLHDKCDKDAHLWTIQDARDGDILQLGIVTVIFQQCIDNNCKCYCSVCDGEFEIPSQDGDNNIYGCYNATPATKEQHYLLFQKMKEARYIFDFKNKELKKIETEIEIPFGAKDSELQEATYYIPKGFYAEIDNDKVVIKKGKNLLLGMKIMNV